MCRVALRVRELFRRDDGSSVVEMVLLTPLVVLFFGFVPVQLGVWFHERHLLTAAAHEASRAASVADYSNDQARAAGQSAVDGFIGSSGVLSNVTVANVNVDTDTVTVTVTATGFAVFPLPDISMEATATSARERFVGAP